MSACFWSEVMLIEEKKEEKYLYVIVTDMKQYELVIKTAKVLAI